MVGIRKKITCSRCDMVLELSRIFKQAYCKACDAERIRNTRRKYGDLSPLARMKADARATANRHVRSGKIKKHVCCECGAHEAEMHHEDYSKPLEVIWLCRPCHLEHHKQGEDQIVA